ncbi:hypothetical protein QQ91_0002625, partial [Lyngbya confervoides BDU141951]|nr:hypothetical protein [Lyngbya confervoides BDU141951]
MARSRTLVLQTWTEANNALNLHFEGNKSELARKLKISRTTVTNFFNGQPVSDGYFRKICLQLRINWETASRCHENQRDQSKVLEQTKQDLEDLIQRLREGIHADIVWRCGTMQVLDMTQPVGLGDIYTDVNILEKPTALNRREIPELLENYKIEDAKAFNRIGFGKIKGAPRKIALVTSRWDPREQISRWKSLG